MDAARSKGVCGEADTVSFSVYGDLLAARFERLWRVARKDFRRALLRSFRRGAAGSRRSASRLALRVSDRRASGGKALFRGEALRAGA